MKKKIASLLSVFCLASLMLSVSGCDETDLSNAVFFITPDQATLNKDGDTVVFQAVGGSDPLTWSVSDDAMGTLSGGGRSVTYARTGKSGANTITVRNNQQWSATALVIQEDPLGGLAVTPTQVTLSSNGARAIFTATGGTRPYIWSLENDSGSIVSIGENQAIYTRLSSTNNSVIVIDQLSHAVMATISQP